MIRKEIIGVYGTGTIGSGQATLTTGNGYAVVVVGHSARGISRCKRAIEHNWDDLIAEGLASEENKAAAMNLLIFSDELNGQPFAMREKGLHLYSGSGIGRPGCQAGGLC